MTALIYIHGFLSSPDSHKAQVLKRWVAQHAPDVSFHCPQLTPYPAQTRRDLDTLMEFLQPEPVWLIGSSLGGFWATWLAEHYDLPAVLVNPSVRPWASMVQYLGVDLVSYHTDDSYRLEAAHIDEMQAADCTPIRRPHNYWLMAQTGDEVLDYRHAIAKYHGCKQLIEPAGDHSFVGFENHVADIMTFFRAFSAMR
ncbi:YqiA/YcfP family alpha/beta fold hydrolase [Gilvimarinus polysaccharolyticus]|uniref:YqiA/YcfP family alpha/beta fold hydrolase n=1 Tax=Gilvimarinus polysaccharolyticus TaxID=863921 RepID=UPI000673458A|nr:YqiA/YcfP family alpha/beta fold hydrolase [Gilvimarinus polysaccharolyticus]